MGLIEKIIESVKRNAQIKDPIFDLKLDEKGVISGTIASKSFEDEGNWYKIVFSTLQESLQRDELTKIKMIYLESPLDLITDDQDLLAIGTDIKRHKYWYSYTPDNNRYLAIIDMKYIEIDKVLKVFYIVNNPDYGFKENYLINYDKKVIDFLELQEGELLDYAFDNAWNNIVAAIKFDLMKRHTNLYESGKAEWINKYSFVYDDSKFKIKPLNLLKTILTISEISQLNKIITIKELHEFKFIDELIKQIDFSQEINRLKTSLNIE